MNNRTQRITDYLRLLCLLVGLTLLPVSGEAKNGDGVFDPAPVLASPPVPPQFDLTGFIQEATLDKTGIICQASDPRLAGGTLKVNNIQVIIPCNTILQMPAATLTWQELFSLAPRDIGLPLDEEEQPTQTGLALADNVKLPIASPYNGPLPSYEVHVQGNVVNGRYIAGLVFISQQNLNIGQGIITAIDYDNAELLIASSGPDAVISRVRINDPLGRYGLSHGAPGSDATLIEPGYDVRFSIDEDSPTIHATTGYPMCIPRSDPFTVGDDPDCPQANRPRSPHCASLPAPFPAFVAPADGQYCSSYVMPPPSWMDCTPEEDQACPPDPTRQAPFEIGDFIDYLGTLKVDSRGAYISAHTVNARLAIYTAPGWAPVYVILDELIQGTSSQPLFGLTQEATSRIKVEGFTTDPTALIDIYAVDVDPGTGNLSDRWLGSANPSGPPVIGRFRFMPNAGAYLPATREVRVVSRTLCGDAFWICELGYAALPDPLPANGLVAGQYHAPNFEFIFAENINQGDAIVPANLQDLAFLYCGSGPLTTPTADHNAPLVHQLDPPPWAPPMPTPGFAASTCSWEPLVGAAANTVADSPPLIKVFPGEVVNVNTGAAVFLSASASDASGLPVAVNWVQSGGARTPLAPEVPPGQPNAITFISPVGPSQMIFTVTATNLNTGLSSTATATVNIMGRAPDLVRIHSAAWTSTLKNRGALSVVAYSDAPLDINNFPPADLQLYVQASAMVAALVPDGDGGLVYRTSAVQLAATPLPMFYADTGNPPTCPAGLARCWQFTTRGALVDPNGEGIFVPPDLITVTSSRGGTDTMGTAEIILR